MTRKIAIAALVMLSLGGCVVVPVGSAYPHFGWLDSGWDHRYPFNSAFHDVSPVRHVIQ
jgi:hypothetical protein